MVTSKRRAKGRAASEEPARNQHQKGDRPSQTTRNSGDQAALIGRLGAR